VPGVLDGDPAALGERVARFIVGLMSQNMSTHVVAVGQQSL
jgi:hypothetical protein